MNGTTVPRIYVASLSDYNNGRLVGAWIDCDQSGDDIRAEIDEMLAAAGPDREEWAIHDYEGFGGWKLHEWQDLDEVAAVAELIGDGNPAGAVAAWIDYRGDVSDAVATFEDAYHGEWDSEADYAQDMAESCGMVPGTDRWPMTRIDWEWAARDLFCGDYVAAADGVGGVYVFDACV